MSVHQNTRSKQFTALTRCFFCGEPDRILIHTRLRDISEANGKVIDREPCAKCADLMKKGVMLLSVRDGESGDNPYRTGRMVVIKDEAIRRIVTNEAVRESVLKHRFAFIPDTTWEAIGLAG